MHGTAGSETKLDNDGLMVVDGHKPGNGDGNSNGDGEGTMAGKKANDRDGVDRECPQETPKEELGM